MQTPQTEANSHVTTSEIEEGHALNYVKGIKEFYQHVFFYLFFGAIIAFNKGLADPQTWWVIGGWSIGIAIHGLVAYEKINFFSARWEKEQVEKRLGRKL